MRTFAQLLESFLVEYAPRRRCLSDNTLRSYRDTFVLLLRWLSEEEGRLPDSISIGDLGRSRIEGFCLWLASARGSGPSTVNARLSAIRSFASYVASVEPEHLAWMESIREIAPSKAPRKEIGYLSPEAQHPRPCAPLHPLRLRRQGLRDLVREEGGPQGRQPCEHQAPRQGLEGAGRAPLQPGRRHRGEVSV